MTCNLIGLNFQSCHIVHKRIKVLWNKLKIISLYQTSISKYKIRGVARGGLRGLEPPPEFGNQLTLFKPGGAGFYTTASPPGFKKLSTPLKIIYIFETQTTLWEKNLPKTLDQLIFCKCTLIFTKYLVKVPKYTKYLVDSYHQKGVKDYILINWNQITPI